MWPFKKKPPPVTVDMSRPEVASGEQLKRLVARSARLMQTLAQDDPREAALREELDRVQAGIRAYGHFAPQTEADAWALLRQLNNTGGAS